MSLPEGAVLEKADPTHEVEIWDVSHLLPRHRSKTYRHRSPSQISEVYVHHSGKLGKPGFLGLVHSTRYVVYQRGWPGCPYHLWIPYEQDGGEVVVLRAQKDIVRTYHAGKGPNDRAVAICLQGNMGVREPSCGQYRALSALIDLYGLPVLGHCEAPGDGHAKAACPGGYAMPFVKGKRA